MKAMKILDSKVGMVTAAAAVVGVGLYLAEKKIRDGASAVGDLINPVSDKNFIYRGVNGVGAALTGNQNFDLGVWTYDVFNGNG